MIKAFSSQKGFGIVSLILLAALVVAVLSAYAYFNPSFSLAKYSPLNYFRVKQDEIRIRDLKALEKAVGQYYDDNNEMPASNNWCGRISGVIHPEFATAMDKYFGRGGLPSDPSHGGTEKDYFYYKIDRSHYILMADLEIPRDQGLSAEKYNFNGCHDWPGDNVYNYQLSNLDN